jgi:cysteine-dependent adenosine diphosphate thiazole synthase
MAPIAVSSLVDQDPISLLKQGLNGNSTHTNDNVDVKEDYAGDYRFAPIEEAQVSRAMIKRYVLTIIARIRRTDG